MDIFRTIEELSDIFSFLRVILIVNLVLLIVIAIGITFLIITIVGQKKLGGKVTGLLSNVVKDSGAPSQKNHFSNYPTRANSTKANNDSNKNSSSQTGPFMGGSNEKSIAGGTITSDSSSASRPSRRPNNSSRTSPNRSNTRSGNKTTSSNSTRKTVTGTPRLVSKDTKNKDTNSVDTNNKTE